MLYIVYETRVGNTKYVAQRIMSTFIRSGEGKVTLTDLSDWPLLASHVQAGDRIIFVTPTYENLREQRLNPEAPLRYTSKDLRSQVQLAAMQHMLAGVVICGNTNFGDKFCAAEYDFHPSIPILGKIDVRGNQDDYDAVVSATVPF